MKHLKSFENINTPDSAQIAGHLKNDEYCTFDIDNADKYRRERILTEFEYRTREMNLLDKIVDKLTTGEILDKAEDPIAYLTDSNKYDNIKNELYEIADEFVDGVIKQDINEFVSQDLYISYIYNILPSTSSDVISDFVDEITNKFVNGKPKPLHKMVLEIIFPEIFNIIEGYLLNSILIKIEEEPTYFKKVQNAQIKYLSTERWNEFLNKIYKEKPELKRGRDSGLLDTKIR